MTADESGPSASKRPRVTSQPTRPTRREFLAIGAGTALGATAGCTSVAPSEPPAQVDTPTTDSQALPTRPETIFMADVGRTGYWPDETVPEAVTHEWTFEGVNTGDHTAAKSSPLVHDGAVIAPGDSATVYSVTPDGEQNWETSLVHSTRGTHSTPAIVGDYIFTSGYDGATYAFDVETGERLWRTKVSDAIGSSPVYYDGVVYVATEFYTPSGGITALDAATGAVLWEDNRMTNHAHSITGIDPETRAFAAGCNDGSLYVWDLDSREFRDRFPTDGAIKGPICMYDGMALFGSWDGTVYAVDTDSVTEEWSHHVDWKVMSGGAVHPEENLFVVGSHGSELYALDLDTGDRKWTFDTGGWVTGSVTIAGDTVLAGSYDTTAFAIDVASGEERWRFERPHGWVTCAPAVHDGAVYVTERATFSNDQLEEAGHLYKLTEA